MHEYLILNVVIYFDNYDEIVTYIDRVSKLNSSNTLAVVVVINKVNEADKERVFDFQNNNSVKVFVVDACSNLGYMNGLLYGYNFFLKSVGYAPKYVLMGNTDICFPSSDFLEKLLHNKYDSTVGVIGPSVYSSNEKTYDNPVAYERRKRSRVKQIIACTGVPVLRDLYLFASHIKARIFGRKTPDASAFVYEVHGCFFILTKEFANVIKDIHYGCLMYSEEAFIAEEAYRNGYSIYYDDSICIIHEEHSITGLLKSKKVAYYISSSMKYILEHYY